MGVHLKAQASSKTRTGRRHPKRILLIRSRLARFEEGGEPERVRANRDRTDRTTFREVVPDHTCSTLVCIVRLRAGERRLNTYSHTVNLAAAGAIEVRPSPSCLVVRPFVVALPTVWSFVCAGAASCAYSCSAHVRPCAQGCCGRCPPGSGVMSDFFYFFFHWHHSRGTTSLSGDDPVGCGC